MLHQLRQKELIRKKIIYLKDRVSENPLLQSILDEYIYLFQQVEKVSHDKIKNKFDEWIK
jgi:hypothetical protein